MTFNLMFTGITTKFKYTLRVDLQLLSWVLLGKVFVLFVGSWDLYIPRCSMYGIFTYLLKTINLGRI